MNFLNYKENQSDVSTVSIIRSATCDEPVGTGVEGEAYALVVGARVESIENQEDCRKLLSTFHESIEKELSSEQFYHSFWSICNPSIRKGPNVAVISFAEPWDKSGIFFLNESIIKLDKKVVEGISLSHKKITKINVNKTLQIYNPLGEIFNEHSGVENYKSFVKVCIQAAKENLLMNEKLMNSTVNLAKNSLSPDSFKKFLSLLESADLIRSWREMYLEGINYPKIGKGTLIPASASAKRDCKELTCQP